MKFDLGLVALIVAFGHIIFYAIHSALSRNRTTDALVRLRELERRFKNQADQCNSDHDKIVDLEIELNNVR
ncbi:MULTISPECIES: hypothetical protein [Limibacillus]|jgi:hypothetical protein|uniref:BhlA holin family protein n=1 Tax=Limibacillus halophilus TaxID=1579333 RepID=A0A839SUA3_9PROT|nr:hypothetical protein [Limibacillus halophilus]MBB3065579.1 hypothetical protein [Limibacillus halophilus]